MGNKQNRARKKKRRTGHLFTEWKVLNDFGLVKSRAKKATSTTANLEFQPDQPILEDPTTPFEVEFQPDQPILEEPTTPFEEEFLPVQSIPEEPTTPFEEEFLPVQSIPEEPTTPFEEEFLPVQSIPEEPTTPFEEDFQPVEQQAQTNNQSLETLTGRRIIDIAHFFNEVKQMGSHDKLFGCTLNNMTFQNEIVHGLRSGFTFKCNMCGFTYTLWSEPERLDVMDINKAAVAAVMNAGGGFTTLSQIMAGLDVHCMNSKTYDRNHEKVAKGWEDTALEVMKAAAAEEATMARERGDVDKYGVPLLTVVTDASWAKRSYRTNYNSLSGVAAIMGYHTKKVLHIGVKNRYCTVCARDKALGKTTTHACFKNWNSSSCSMESAGIVEGFLSSIEMYGVKYSKIIADGDSSVLQKINETRPYDDIRVGKIECRNHLLRNYSTKLKDIATAPLKDLQLERGTYCRLRKQVGASIMRLRTAVTKAIEHRKKGQDNITKKSQLLRQDILNGPCHVFGEHDRCAKYFCKGTKERENNRVPVLKRYGIYQKIMHAVQTLADKSLDLIHDVDSNLAEHYNAAVARLIGGKRINYCLKNSYQARCSAAVVSFNSGKAHYRLHKTMCKSSPGAFAKRFEEKRLRKIQLARQRRLLHPKPRRKLISEKTDATYGPLCNKPDLNLEVYEDKAKDHWEKLHLSQEERNALEKNTQNQSGNELWMEERRIRLTASNFGLICNRKPHSNSAPVVTSLLYSSPKDCAATAYGREHEATAIRELSNLIGKPIEKCGLFIDKDLPFLGATPDGLVGDDNIVEIKCPYSGMNLTPEEVIEQKKGEVGKLFMYKKSEEILEMKKKHRYHFQIQGQLHITERKCCIFVLWTPLGMKTFSVFRDDRFWEKEMKEKLTLFYKCCLLPELLDPRRRRSLPLREPLYIREAQKNKQNNKPEEENLARPLCS